MAYSEPGPCPGKTTEDLGMARNAYISDVYPELFGSGFDSDSTVEITALNVTALLMQYEQRLYNEGLLNIRHGKQE